MIAYDPTLIQQFAERLYARARNVVVSYAILGFLTGGIAGFGFGTAVIGPRSGAGMPAALVVGVLGVVMGVMLGLEKAFWLKLEAQRALCQLQTELNTRPGHAGAHLPARAA